MSVEAEAADGTIHEFPDGTPGAVIDRAMRDYAMQAKQSAPAAQPAQAGVGVGRDIGLAATGFNRMLGNAVAFPFEAAAGFNEMTGINAAYEGLTGYKADRRPLISNEDAQSFINSTFGATDPENFRERAIAAGGAGLGAAVMGAPAMTAIGLPAVTPAAATAGGFLSGVAGQAGAEGGEAIAGPDGRVVGGLVGSIAGGMVVPSTLGGSTATARTGAALARPLTQSGREAIVGQVLNRAAGNGATAVADEPIQGINATLGQRTANRGLLALEKTQAQSSPENVSRFHENLSNAQALVRNTLERLRGTGAPTRPRDVAEQQIAQADAAAASELHALQSGRTPTQASDLARQRIEATRQAFRERETELWRAVGADGDGAMVPVDPLRTRLRAYLSRQPKAYDNAMPEDVQAALYRLNPNEPLSELTPIRTMLRENAQAARAANNPRMARIYSGLEREVGEHLDNLQFDDANVQGAYQAARDFSRHRAQLFNQQDEVRGTLGVDRFGAPRTSSGETLGNFVQPGPGGRDSLRQLFALDNTPEMRSLVADHFVASMPQGVTQARAWLNRFSPALSEMPQLQAQLQNIVGRRAAAEALRETPLAMFAGASPEKAIQRLIGSPDAVRNAAALRVQLRNTPDAWRGIQSSYADEIMRRVGSLVEQDATGNPTILPSKIAAFVRDNTALSREILGPDGALTLRTIADAMQMVTRTSRGGFPGGSDTFSKLSGSRFVDRIVEAAMDERAPATAGAAGFGVGSAVAGPFVGGPLGGALGYGGGAASRAAYSQARQQIDTLLSDALLNPELGRALMRRASTQSLEVLPRGVRPYLAQFVVGSGAGAAATGRGQSEDRGRKKPN